MALELERRGLKVWIDECQLTLGDSLRRSVDRGLLESRFGIVVLSPAFLDKEWPNKELGGLVAREQTQGKVILPVWHKVNAQDVAQHSPMLADKMGISTGRGVSQVASEILRAVEAGGSSTVSVSDRQADHEREVLSRLRTKMITAANSTDLRRTVYELDEHLARYPNSPEARLLRDQIGIALQRSEMLEKRREQDIEAAAYNLPGSRSQLRPLLCGLIVLILGCLFYWLMRSLAGG